ncbi:MAG: hypothetical protein GF365_04620 [Candidatus Buchananbacteria bacterium]|nr:hypothetical protein [Candidatus Buchananbacteria bacterium]
MELKITREIYDQAIKVNGQIEFEQKWSVVGKIFGHIFFLFCRAETWIRREYWRKFVAPKLDKNDLRNIALIMDPRKHPVAKFLYESSNYVTFLKHHAMEWTAIEAIYNERDWLRKEKSLLSIIVTFLLSRVENIVATRNRLRNTKRAMFQEIVHQLESGAAEIRIVSLASGSARSSIEVVAAILRENPQLLDKFRIWFVDADPKAFEFTKALAKEKYPGLEKQFEFWNTKISRKMFDNLSGFLKEIKPAIVEMVGFGDYLPTEKAIQMNRIIYEGLSPGGVLITNNVKDNDERKFLEIVVTWTMLNRSEEEVNEILAEAGFKVRTILNEPCDIQPVYLARKLSNE